MRALLTTTALQARSLGQVAKPVSAPSYSPSPHCPAPIARRAVCLCDSKGTASTLSSLPAVVIITAEDLPTGPGVYAIYDRSDQLQYVGLSRMVDSSLLEHAESLPDLAFSAKVRSVPSGDKGLLQKAWKEMITQHDPIHVVSVPVTRKPAGPTPQDLREEVLSNKSEKSRKLINNDVIRGLATRGFAVIDGAMDHATMDAAFRDVEMIREIGMMRPVSSQYDLGRQDEIAVLDDMALRQIQKKHSRGASGTGGDADRESFAGLLALSALLKGLPEALMLQQEQAAQGPSWMPELAVPRSLMLAVYPGEGAYYARHLDNDVVQQSYGGEAGTSGPSWQGPPGQRVADRAVTAIIYLNQDWVSEKNGGNLRLFHAGGSPGGEEHTDVAPLAGRLVLFQSRLLDHEVLPAYHRRWALSAWIPSLEAFTNNSTA
eukprot:gene30218-35206_t